MPARATRSPRPRVLFVSTGLATGGAERMLARLVGQLHGNAIDAGVVALQGRGPVSDVLEAAKVPLWHLDLARAEHLPLALSRLASIARHFCPDMIQGWMYHGNLAACWVRAWAPGQPRLVWSVRQSLYDLTREKPGTRRVIRVGQRLSSRVDAIVYNSYTARHQHESLGYAGNRTYVIDNGVDASLFQPDPSARERLCAELGIGLDYRLIGLVARYHPMKGHRVFLEAAGKLAPSSHRTHFVLAGTGVVPDNPAFRTWLDSPALAGRLHLLGERRDMPGLTAALDLATSASTWGEAFANTLVEAMSCAVPCVATNVGDSNRILGDTGIVVPPADAGALADAWARLLALPEQARRAIGQGGRARILERYTIERIASRYATFYKQVIATPALSWHDTGAGHD